MAPPRTDRPRGRRSDAASNTRRIIESGYALLSRDGNTPLDEVASHAGVGIATLYRHFPNRAALTRAVFESVFDREVAPLLAAVDINGPGRETFLDFATRLLDIIDRERQLLASTANLASLTDDLLQHFTEPFTRLLQRGQEVGEIRPDLEPDDVPPILVMLVTGLSAAGIIGEARNRYLAIVFDGLRPGNHQPLPPVVPADRMGSLRTGMAAIASSDRHR